MSISYEGYEGVWSSLAIICNFLRDKIPLFDFSWFALIDLDVNLFLSFGSVIDQ